MKKFIGNYQTTIRHKKKPVSREGVNIYVLFALAIIGAFFSIISRSSFKIDTIFLIGFGVFASASLFFLIIKMNTVALTAPTSGKSKIDNYSEYLFSFSINGSLLLGGVVTLINIFNIQLNTFVPSIIPVAIAMIVSFLISSLTYLQDKRSQQKRRIRIRMKSEEIREEMLDEMTSGFEELRQADDGKEELKIFNELVDGLEQARDEFPDVERLEPIEEELEDLEKVPDEMAEVLRETFEETQSILSDEESNELTLEERREQLQEEYEEILAESEA